MDGKGEPEKPQFISSRPPPLVSFESLNKTPEPPPPKKVTCVVHMLEHTRQCIRGIYITNHCYSSALSEVLIVIGMGVMDHWVLGLMGWSLYRVGGGGHCQWDGLHPGGRILSYAFQIV